MTRVLDAPRSLVFEAWSRPEHLSKWFGPIGFTVTCSLEFRVGGALRITMAGHGMVHTVHGTYREIVRPERIVQSLAFEDLPGHAMIQTITFVETDGKTTLTVRHEFPRMSDLTPAQRQLIEPRMAGAREGWSQALQHLVEFVATQR